jgi:hypothetical protein
MYRGTYTSELNGTYSAPIIVRQYPGERAIIDGGDSGGQTIFMVQGSWTWFWGFEVTSTSTRRVSSQAGSHPTDIGSGEGIDIAQTTGSGVGCRFINLTVHDTRQGFGFWEQAQNAEIYGNVIFNNGWDGPDTAHGHGIYTQNNGGTKRIRDNFVFNQFGHNLHAYGSDAAHLNNFDIEGNVFFGASSVSMYPGTGRNVLLGGGSVAEYDRFAANSMYGPVAKFGYGAPVDHFTMTGNYLMSDENALEIFSTGDASVTGNDVWGTISGFSASQYLANVYFPSHPTGVKVIVRANIYEPGRANLVIWNWDNQPRVAADLSAVLKPGDTFEIRDVQNYLGAPAIRQRYTGGPVAIPMNTLTAVDGPTGGPVRVTHTPPQFGAFVVLRISSGQAAGGNQPPVVSAGANQTITFPNAAVLRGSATDAGAPRAPTVAWSQVSGPGGVAFSAPAATTTSAWFSGPGTYVFRLSATDGALVSSATVQVVVNPIAAVVSGPNAYISFGARSGRIRPPMMVTPDARALSGAEVSSPVFGEGTATYWITIPKASVYLIWCHVLVNASPKSFFVSADGGPEDIFVDGAQRPPPVYQWARVNGTGTPIKVNPRRFVFSAGPHSITFRGRDPNTALDSLIVTNNLAYVP